MFYNKFIFSVLNYDHMQNVNMQSTDAMLYSEDENYVDENSIHIGNWKVPKKTFVTCAAVFNINTPFLYF